MPYLSPQKKKKIIETFNEHLAFGGSCCSPQRINLFLFSADGAPQELLVLSLLLIQLIQQSETQINSLNMTQQKAVALSKLQFILHPKIRPTREI